MRIMRWGSLLIAIAVLLAVVSPALADTEVTVVVGGSGNVTANLGVVTPQNADVNVNINAGTASLEVNGVTPSQVSIGGSNVQTTISDTAATTANAVHTSMQGVMFNEENYKMWVLPLQKRLDIALGNIDYVNNNLDMTMDGLAKVITALQDDDTSIQEQRSAIATLSTTLRNDVAARERHAADNLAQFGYVDTQFQSSIDRDRTTLELLGGLEQSIGTKIKDNELRVDALVEQLTQLRNDTVRLHDEVASLRSIPSVVNDATTLVSILFGTLILVIVALAYKVSVKK